MTHSELTRFDLHVRGEIPSALEGFLVVPMSRRDKRRKQFSRWHDSQTDLLRLQLTPGRPGKITATILGVDPTGADLGSGFTPNAYEVSARSDPAYGYATQPNHGINVSRDSIWVTNLLFGAPLEIDIKAWQPKRILRHVEPRQDAPRVSSTSHFATSLDHRYTYYHQSLLEQGDVSKPAATVDLHLVELDTITGSERIWRLEPPDDDADMSGANFHSAFYFEEAGRKYVGFLRTGAVIDHLRPHTTVRSHSITPMKPSTIWIVCLDHSISTLKAVTLPGIEQLNGLAMSHLDVEAGIDGFVLYANFKEADVAEETHGPNVYREDAEEIVEHYSGMTVEALNHGLVIRYERRNGTSAISTFTRPYDYRRTSLGHTWLPVNIQLGSENRFLFCTFSGFRPRLLSQHIAAAYEDRLPDLSDLRYIPPALIRLDAKTLTPDADRDRSHISYAEPMAMAVVRAQPEDFVCTFSPDVGLRIYHSNHLSRMVCHAVSPDLMHWRDSHFRPDPAHMLYVRPYA